MLRTVLFAAVAVQTVGRFSTVINYAVMVHV